MKIVWFRLTPYRVPPDRGITKRLHRITAPTLVLWGDEDRGNPVVRAAVDRGAPAQLRSGGHMLIHELPEATAATVLRFLR